MTCTNDDLKRLKWEAAGGIGDKQIDPKDVLAVIARLEAAEADIEAHHQKMRLDCESGCTYYEAWRKTKGEAGK